MFQIMLFVLRFKYKLQLLVYFFSKFLKRIISFYIIQNITLQDGEIKTSEAYKSRQREEVSEVWPPFTGPAPGRLRRVRRRPASPQEPSFWSWFLIFKRLFHN